MARPYVAGPYGEPVWASLDTWLIGDGQFPQLEIGAVVHDCGLRLNCSHLGASNAPVREISDAPVDEAGRARYRLTGRCRSVTGATAALIAMPGWLAAAEPETYRVVRGALRQPASQQWSEHFRPPGPNDMVDAEGWLEVVADHEWDAFRVPDSRMSWRLVGIQLLEHRLVQMPEEPPDTPMYGRVVRITHPDRLSWTADKLKAGRYLIDLIPASPAERGAGRPGSAFIVPKATPTGGLWEHSTHAVRDAARARRRGHHHE
jgi:hypothetical protein